MRARGQAAAMTLDRTPPQHRRKHVVAIQPRCGCRNIDLPCQPTTKACVHHHILDARVVADASAVVADASAES